MYRDKETREAIDMGENLGFHWDRNENYKTGSEETEVYPNIATVTYLT